MRYRMGQFELDLGSRTISGPDGPIHVEPQVFDVAVFLLEHRDRAIAKTELLDEIWGDQFVSETALTSRIKSARAALGDSGREQAVIRTVHGYGYQFVADVHAVGDDEPTSRRHDRLSSMPRFRDPLRGRSGELARVIELVADEPLVTLLGPGGTGKTRLSVEVVESMQGSELQRAFVDLAATRDAESLPSTIAATLGIDTGQRADPIDAVCEVLGAFPHLLVLDNCEHVLDAARDAVDHILRRVERSRVLATSREPLGLQGERLYRLAPLPVIAPSEVHRVQDLESSPATALFLDRARLVDENLTVSEHEARQIAELCGALDGLPLAIELAAGRTAAFGLDGVTGLLPRRLDALGDRSRTREGRHRTLRATVEWSYALLEQSEQRLFTSLALLPGGVTLEGIEWMSEHLGLGLAGLDAASRLVDASFLTRVSTASGSRFVQLETLRAFGLDQLESRGDADALRRYAAEYTLDMLARVDHGPDTRYDAAWTDRMQREFPNVRAARAFFVEHGPIDELVTLSRRLTRWTRMRELGEVWEWSDDLLRRCPSGHDRHAAALAIHAQAEWRRGNIAGARSDAEQALAATTDDSIRAEAMFELGAAMLFAGDLAHAEEVWVAASELRYDPFSLGSAAIATAYAGNLERARSLLATCSSDAGSLTVPGVWIDYCTAEVEHTVGQADLGLLERAVERARQLDVSFVLGVSMVTLASLRVERGERAEAARLYEELIEHWLRSGSWTQQWTTLRHVAELIEDSQPGTALLILRAADADGSSRPALADGAAERLSALSQRLVQRVSGEVMTPGSRVEVAEMARAALHELR